MDATRKQVVRRIERAAEKKLTKLDLSYLKKASCESEKHEFPSVEHELPAVPLPREQLSQLSQDLSDSEPEEIPEW